MSVLASQYSINMLWISISTSYQMQWFVVFSDYLPPKGWIISPRDGHLSSPCNPGWLESCSVLTLLSWKNSNVFFD